jgi:hypothetical protein
VSICKTHFKENDLESINPCQFCQEPLERDDLVEVYKLLYNENFDPNEVEKVQQMTNYFSKCGTDHPI